MKFPRVAYMSLGVHRKLRIRVNPGEITIIVTSVVNPDNNRLEQKHEQKLFLSRNHAARLAKYLLHVTKHMPTSIDVYEVLLKDEELIRETHSQTRRLKRKRK